MNRLLIAHTPIGEDWWAMSLEGTESLSELYAFTLTLKSDKSDIDGQSLIGEVCAVELEAQRDIKRYFSGQIIKVAACGKAGRHWQYKATIAPKLWHASRRADFKIWQGMSVPDITDKVLQQNALRYEWRLKGQYRKWEYLVQYGETDLNFLCRLFEHEGIYYWFEHGSDGEKLILGDHFSTHEPFGGYEHIPFYPPDEVRSSEDHYLYWSAAREPEPGRYQHRDYDFKQPSKDMTTQSVDPRGHLFDQYEIYTYPGHYIEPGDGSSYATARLEALQTQQNVIGLEGRVRGAIPGCRFALGKHPVESLNREYMITRAEYKAANNDYEATDTTNKGAHFNVRIEALPADRQYRSLQKTPKPRTRGPETAVVVGPAGSEIHTDQYGRVKVHFHWDRYGKKDGNDSCWIRVSYPWAGSNFGGIHIPRVGQEVIVDHEYGDPDRPFITGRVYNAEQMPPWELPANKTQSGILTRSTLKGAYSNANALRFEDAKGEEQVWLHAERNQDIEVEVDETHWVGQDRQKTIDRDEKTVIHRHRTETVDGNERITVHRTRSKTVDMTETNLTGIAKVDTVGVTNLDNVGMARMSNIGMIYSLNVGMLMNTLVGRKQSTKVGAEKTLTVGKTYAANIGETMKFAVGKTLEFSCGSSRIVMTPDGIYLESGHIELRGQSAINGDAGLIQWNAGASSPPPNADGAKEENPPIDAPDAEPEVIEKKAAPPVRKNILEPDFDGGKFALATGVAAGIAGAVAAPELPAPGSPGGAASPLSDPAVQAIIAKSPTLQADLEALDAQEWQVQYGPAGSGSTADRYRKVISIDSNEKNNPERVVQTISHEVGHAKYPYVPDFSSKEAYLSGAFADEGAATMKNIQVQREIIGNGGANIGIAGNSANHAAYNAAYDQYLSDGNAAAARNTIGSAFATGEKTSNTNQTYQDYYGDWYDKNYGKR
ncbi:MAG: type VI secretion system tip protein VgrG [Azoarcus sp.]|jgi:type VI secretion system secreted protein VgrG|nr:type VI secretion system tip protein VgrG [Azoarcus sp.]